MTTTKLFTELGKRPDFRAMAKMLDVSMSTYLASLVAQAKVDPMFLLASELELVHRGVYAKQESSRKANLQSMDGRGTARANLRDRTMGNRGQRK